MLFGAESWYAVTNNQLDKLEWVDISYFRKLFNSSYSTAKEIYYLECGKIPLKHVLISCRLMFWWHIVRTDKDSLLSRFHNLQKLCPVKNDWSLQIEKDKLNRKDVNINY